MVTYTVTFAETWARKWILKCGWMDIIKNEGLDDAEPLYSRPDIGKYALTLEEAVAVQYHRAMRSGLPALKGCSKTGRKPRGSQSIG